MKTPTAPHRAAETKMASIRALVADHFLVPRAAMTSRDRTEPLATYRQVAMLLARETTGATLQRVAISFGRGDHGTVEHACRVVPNKALTDRKLRAGIALLRSKLKEAA